MVWKICERYYTAEAGKDKEESDRHLCCKLKFASEK